MKTSGTDRDARTKKILLVDDEPVNLRILSQILKDRYRLMLATSGEEALKCVDSPQPPDLILLDIVMPEMDGFEVCQRLKERDSTSNIPIIFVTGRTEDQVITRAMEAGGADCIRKPVHPEVLKARISGQLALKLRESRNARGHDMMAAALKQEKDANLALKAALRSTENELDSLRQHRHMFLAEMHHEIKTHLTTIVGMTDLSLNQELSPILHDYITTIQSTTDTLVALINDILDLSMLKDGDIETREEEFSPEHLVNDTIDACGEIAFAREAELVVDISPRLPALLLGQSTRIRQLLTHLIHFNIRWLGGKQIFIEISGHLEDSGLFMLECAVSCLDVSLADREVRELFSCINTLGRTKERQAFGCGLGLPICSQIVENMSGHMDLRNSPGCGITFTCSIPVTCRHAAPFPFRTAPDCTQAMRALVADDSPLAARITAKMLTAAGFSVDIVPGLEEVLEKFPDTGGISHEAYPCSTYDLLVLDWKMPGMDGMEITGRLRRQGIDTPVVIAGMPVLLMMSMRHELEKSGHDNPGAGVAFIMKPVKREALYEKINELLCDNIHTGEKGVSADRAGRNAGLKGLRVLLVEDNRINRHIATQLLEMEGMEVIEAASGKMAVDMASRNETDVILMDIELPDINGMEASRQIRAIPSCTDIPVIALTAHSCSDHKKACGETDMCYCIEKPIDPDELYAKILKAVTK